MVQEAYVSFETSKLLKEKGFDEDIDLWYDEKGDKFFKYHYEIKNDWRVRQNQQVYQCPTQQMAMRWLREVHNLNVEPYATAPGFRFLISKAGNIKVGDISGGTSVYDSNFDGPNDGGAWDTYEDACEAAIKYCLTNLI